MLATKLYAPTLREVPSDADVVSQQLMLRAGFMRKTANGLYSFLPLGWRSIKKIEAIVREEMDRASAQEIMMPILQPAEIWKESGRWNAYGAEMMRINDRHDNEFCLGPTHEEMITTLVKNEINSYRQLPVNLYQIQSKFRDERRPRYGLMRSREFIMKDAYSFDVDEAGLDESYKSMYDAYTRIFTRCGLTFRPVEADSGAIGGSGTHEFMAIAEAGEADIVYCTKCDYAANIEIGKPGIMKQDEEALQELSVVDTPNASSIEAVADMLNLPLHKTIKAVVFSIDGKVVLAIVRGDHEVNEVAVQHAVLGSVEPEMATPEELEKVGLTAGFISPIGLKQTEDFAIVVDGKCVGCVGVTFQKDIFLKNAEIGYWLNSQYWGKGIMSQVIKKLCSYLFSNYTIHKICADVFAENKASCIVLEKNGFIQEGYRREHIYKDGCYHDLILYALWRNSDEY